MSKQVVVLIAVKDGETVILPYYVRIQINMNTTDAVPVPIAYQATNYFPKSMLVSIPANYIQTVPKKPDDETISFQLSAQVKQYGPYSTLGYKNKNHFVPGQCSASADCLPQYELFS
jgi:hypothetical protein